MSLCIIELCEKKWVMEDETGDASYDSTECTLGTRRKGLLLLVVPTSDKLQISW